MKQICILLATFLWVNIGLSQYAIENIQTDFVKYQRRESFAKHLKEKTILANFEKNLDSTTEELYLEAAWAISQFLIANPAVEKGIEKVLAQYENVSVNTQRAFLELIYGIYPNQYQKPLRALLVKEKNPKLFAMQSLYLQRADASDANTQWLLELTRQQMVQSPKNLVFSTLENYLSTIHQKGHPDLPSIIDLFRFQQMNKNTLIYSFQRWNRDYPGMAVIQMPNGKFLRDSDGKLMGFQQLARSSSNLPFFLTNGNTPQGIYKITGTAISKNLFIGPTPNIQLVLPFENDSSLTSYEGLLPTNWQNYLPMQEALIAGKLGRSEIIAHGTTIDPDYFKDQPYYPLTPTMGCLCAKEIWNIFNGKLESSQQILLTNGFIQHASPNAYLMVINIDQENKALSLEEMNQWVDLYEQILEK